MASGLLSSRSYTCSISLSLSVARTHAHTHLLQSEIRVVMFLKYTELLCDPRRQPAVIPVKSPANHPRAKRGRKRSEKEREL